MKAFLSDDHANELKDLDLGTDALPMQHSLGLNWDLKTDTFTFRVENEGKPFTRRGVLSTVNSLYDPLGFVAPVIIQGKALLRELTTETSDWDAPLPLEKKQIWSSWKDSLKELQNIHISRTYAPISSSQAKFRELCIFSDASTKAIGAVAYLRTTDENGKGITCPLTSIQQTTLQELSPQLI